MLCRTENCHFETDLDKLLRDMRTSEDHFLTILNHIHTITHPNHHSLFLNEHIATHRTAISRITAHIQSAEIEYSQMLVRQYPAAVEADAGVLMKRVAYRLLETFFGSISTLNNKIPQILHEYLRLKLQCQRILQQPSPCPHQLIKTVTEYEFKKIRKHLQLLTELTDRLQNGEIDGFSGLQLAALLESRPSNRQPPPATSPFYSTFKISKLRKEKQTSKPEIPVTDKLKPIRKVRGIYENIKDVMDVSRQDFLQDYALAGETEKDEFLRDLLAKNKANQQIIQEWQARRRKIQNKIKNRDLFEIAHNPQSAGIPEQIKPFSSTRKSLLLKLRTSKDSKALPSELLRITHKADQVRMRMRSYNRERLIEEKEAPSQEEEEAILEGENACPTDDRLPTLNKRAHSVDQNYKHIEETPQAKTLSNSIKINEDHLKARGKLEKVEILPAKIKLQLKAFNGVIDPSRKGGKVGELSKYLYF